MGAMLSFPVVASAAEGPIFGPEEFLRQTGKPTVETRTFELGDAAPPFRLFLESPTGASARVQLNGSTLLDTSDFPVTSDPLEREIDPILLTSTNTLEVEVRGVPGAGFTLSLLADLPAPEPPRVEIVSPVPDLVTAAGSVAVEGVWTGEVETVTVGGIPAVLGEGTFRVDDVPLLEGTNRLVAVAEDVRGLSAVDGVTVRRDTAPPRVVIESPEDGARVVDSSVAVAGTVNDVIPGATVNEDDVSVIVNGRPAQVLNRTFFLDELPLSLGETPITVVAVDRAGNEGRAEILVRREPDLAGVGIEIVGGNGQRGAPESRLPEPLTVRLTARDGSPLTGRVVTFAVSRGDGLLEIVGGEEREVTLRTDHQGEASVPFRLGSRSGEGFHRVRVDTPGSLAFAELCATAEPGEPRVLSIARSAPARGLVDRLLSDPLTVIVTDDTGNPVPGVPVTFTVELGGGSLEGEPEHTVITDPDGIAGVFWTLGPRPGAGNQRAVADFPDNPGLPAIFNASAVEPGPAEETRISGVVQDSTGRPIEGARAVLRGGDLTALTGPDGRFVLQAVPPGGHHVVVEGSAANDPSRGVAFPDIEFAVEAFPGVDNSLGEIVVLPFLDADGAKWVGGDENVILEMKGLPGFAIEIFAHSVVLPDGTRGEALMSSSQVQIDKVPMPPPQGSTPLAVGTLQPAGIRFDPPARVIYPNLAGLAPGDVADVFAFHHDIGQFVNVGPGTVSEDASVVVTDPGFGLQQSGWHCLIRMPGDGASCANDCQVRAEWAHLPEDDSFSPSQTSQPIFLSPTDDGKKKARVRVEFRPRGGEFGFPPEWTALGNNRGDPAPFVVVDEIATSPIAEATLMTEGVGLGFLRSPAYILPTRICATTLDVFGAKADLSLFDGQDGDLVPEGEELTIGAFTVANLNDTDGDGIRDDGDGSVTATEAGRDEVDLMKLILAKPEPDFEGMVRLRLLGSGLRLWSAPTKENPMSQRFFPTDSLPQTFWLENQSVSDELRDAKVEITYLAGGAELRDEVTVTGVWSELAAVAHDTIPSEILLQGPTWSDLTEPPRGLVQFFGGAGLLPINIKNGAKNAILLKFVVSPEDVQLEPDIRFDISRRVEARVWHVFDSDVSIILSKDFPELSEQANDETPVGQPEGDESPSVDLSGAMYSYDAPGFSDEALAPRRIMRANFVEFMRVRFDGRRPTGPTVDGSQCSSSVAWHVRHDLVDRGDGVLIRSTGDNSETLTNDIGLDHISVGEEP